MRHLKKFEELNLETYLKYGEMLKKAGHSERGQKMIDWGKRGQLDDTPDVNLWISGRMIILSKEDHVLQVKMREKR